LVSLRDLRNALEGLDEDIAAIRETIKPGSNVEDEQGKYDSVEDVGRLERLVKARERTKGSLEARVGWATMDQARQEAEASADGAGWI